MCVCVFDYYLYHKNILVKINLNIDYVHTYYVFTVLCARNLARKDLFREYFLY